MFPLAIQQGVLNLAASKLNTAVTELEIAESVQDAPGKRSAQLFVSFMARGLNYVSAKTGERAAELQLTQVKTQKQKAIDKMRQAQEAFDQCAQGVGK
jgi:hypothetical protein